MCFGLQPILQDLSQEADSFDQIEPSHPKKLGFFEVLHVQIMNAFY